MYVRMLVLESFPVEYSGCEEEYHAYIDDGMEGIDSEKRRGNRNGRADQGLYVQGFQVREHDHEKLTEVVQCVVASMNGHIGHRAYGVADDIDPEHEQYGEEGGYEGREKKYDRKKKQELEIDKSEGYENEARERSVGDQEDDERYKGLYRDNKKEDGCEPEEFPEYEVPSFDRF